MTRLVAAFVAAVVVFAAATVGFAHGGGSAGLLSDEEALTLDFSTSDGTEDFDVVERESESPALRSSGPTDTTDDGDGMKEPPSSKAGTDAPTVSNESVGPVFAPPTAGENDTASPPAPVGGVDVTNTDGAGTDENATGSRDDTGAIDSIDTADNVTAVPGDVNATGTSEVAVTSDPEAPGGETHTDTNVTAGAETNVPADAETNVPADAETNVTAGAETNVTAGAETNVTADRTVATETEMPSTTTVGGDLEGTATDSDGTDSTDTEVTATVNANTDSDSTDEQIAEGSDTSVTNGDAIGASAPDDGTPSTAGGTEAVTDSGTA